MQYFYHILYEYRGVLDWEVNIREDIYNQNIYDRISSGRRPILKSIELVSEHFLVKKIIRTNKMMKQKHVTKRSAQEFPSFFNRVKNCEDITSHVLTLYKKASNFAKVMEFLKRTFLNLFDFRE